MDQADKQTPQHYRPAEIEWELFHDPHGRPTTPVRMLKTDGPSFLETKFDPDFYIGHHWHPFDTLYFLMEGNMTIGPEGNFVPGDIRWIKAGHAYGPEVAGPDGVRFFLMALGDEIGLNWADLYDTPADLDARLETLPERWGRANVNDGAATDLAPGAQVQTLGDGDPYIQRVQIAPGETLASYHHDVGALYLVRVGTIEVAGEGLFDTEDSRWVPAGHQTKGTTAGPEGADLIIVGIGGQATFLWG
jgi:redox-sensitive bicupin YhaK (pirin superfamily)